MEQQSERFDNCVDWYSHLSGGGAFEDGKYFGWDFGFGFVEVERFDGGYFENGVAFGSGCVEEEFEFGRMRKHIGDFG